MADYTVQTLKAKPEFDEDVKNDLLSLILENDFADIDLATEALLYLRRCATKPECQTWFRDESFRRWFCDVASKTTALCANDGDVGFDKFRRLLWQFLFNVSVGKSEFVFDSGDVGRDAKEVFNDVFLATFRRVSDDKLKEVLTGIIHQRVRLTSSGEFFRFQSEEDNLFLLSSMLASMLNDSTFALLCIQEFISDAKTCVDDGVMKLYDRLNGDAKNLFLDVVAESTHDLSPAVVEGLVGRFKIKSSRILTVLKSAGQPASFELEDATETRKLLSCLAIVSADHKTSLKNDRSLLIDCVYLLRMIHELGKSEIPNVWTPARKLADMNPDDPEGSVSPVFGFKRDLIRVIGNLSHEKSDNQDLVRDIEGVQLLLDCSSADGNNPFITQWVVLAIRNLCFRNKENQEILKEMDTRGTVDKKLLAEVGVDLQ